MAKKKVPQNVEREDEIVGPLTLRDLLFVLGGGGVIFALYSLWVQGWLLSIGFYPLAGLTILITLLFVFFEFNDMNLEEFLLVAIKHWLRPKRYTWEEDNSFLEIQTEVDTKELEKLAQEAKQQEQEEAKRRSRLEKLSEKLELGGKLDTGEEVATESINNPRSESQTPIEEEGELEDVLEESEE